MNEKDLIMAKKMALIDLEKLQAIRKQQTNNEKVEFYERLEGYCEICISLADALVKSRVKKFEGDPESETTA